MKYIIHLTFLLFFTNGLLAQKSIDSLLVSIQNVIEKEKIPGVMISIVRSDTVLYAGGLGYANVKTNEKVTENHLFRLGSISKSITALGIVKLSLENQFSLSSTIQDLDKKLEIENPWDASAPITVEQVLEHTAGFDDVHRHVLYAKKSEETNCTEKVAVHKNSLYVRWKPGTRMAYSNPGYVLAGQLLETVTKTPYNEYLKREILAPLGMDKSGFYFSRPTNYKMVSGHIEEGNELSPIDFKSVNGGPSSDFCSNANEMSLFLMYLLSGKNKLSDKSPVPIENFKRIENPKTTIAAKNGFVGGYGLGNMSIWSNNNLFHGHDGGINGFSSILLYSREANLGLAISMNIQGNIWKITDKILDHFLGKNTYIDTTTKKISNSTKEKFEGFYSLKSPRNQSLYFLQKTTNGHSIEFKENKLLVKDFGGIIRDTLYHKGNNIFYRKDEGIPFLMLLEDEDKSPAIWLGNQYGEKGNGTLRRIKNYSLLACLLMGVQFLFFGLLGIVRQLWIKKQSISSRILLWLSSFFLVFTFISFLITTEFYENAETINLGSVIIFSSSIAFFIFSILSLIQGFKIHAEGLMYKWYYRLTAISLFIVSIWLLSNGLIGFRLWNY